MHRILSRDRNGVPPRSRHNTPTISSTKKPTRKQDRHTLPHMATGPTTAATPSLRPLRLLASATTQAPGTTTNRHRPSPTGRLDLQLVPDGILSGDRISRLISGRSTAASAAVARRLPRCSSTCSTSNNHPHHHHRLTVGAARNRHPRGRGKGLRFRGQEDSFLLRWGDRSTKLSPPPPRHRLLFLQLPPPAPLLLSRSPSPSEKEQEQEAVHPTSIRPDSPTPTWVLNPVRRPLRSSMPRR